LRRRPHRQADQHLNWPRPDRRKAQMPKFKEGNRIMLEAVIVATADTGYTIRIIEGGQDTQTHHLLRVGLGIEEHAVLKP
jgi:hypothetical protein